MSGRQGRSARRWENSCSYRDSNSNPSVVQPVASRYTDYAIAAVIMRKAFNTGSRDNSVGIAMGYRMDGRGSIPDTGKTLFSSPQRPDRLWGPPSLLSNGYRRFFPVGQSGRGVNLTAHLHLVPRSKLVGLHLHSPIRLNGLVLNLQHLIQLWEPATLEQHRGTSDHLWSNRWIR
jgi:hypothetical protein